jgi:hypothetical protein
MSKPDEKQRVTKEVEEKERKALEAQERQLEMTSKYSNKASGEEGGSNE